MAVPSDAHLLAFGRFIHAFAKVEFGIKLVLSGVLQLHPQNAFAVLNRAGSVGLKDIAQGLARTNLRPELAEAFCEVVKDWYSHAPLRNMIAHSTWTKANRQDALFAMEVITRNGKVKWLGLDDDDKAGLTAGEIEAAVYEIHLINERLKSFSRESGLDAIIAKNIGDNGEA